MEVLAKARGSYGLGQRANVVSVVIRVTSQEGLDGKGRWLAPWQIPGI